MAKQYGLSCSVLASIALATTGADVGAQTGPAAAGADAARLETLRQKVESQRQQLDVLKRALADQEAALQEMRRALAETALGDLRGGTGAPAAATAAAVPPAPTQTMQPTQTAQSPQPAAAQGAAASGGQADTAATRQDLAATIFEQPGVLTPRGRFSLDTSLQYAYSSSNRVALVGYTVIPAILIGLIDIREVRRTTWTAALTGRYGITNRFEIEAKLPWVHRSDTSVGREFLEGAATDSRVFDASGSGIGDVELTGRYQFNDGGADKPYYIGSLRLKTRTGTDPFEVLTSKTVLGFRNDGIQTELPTGSGFYALQPALTVLYPSDPAVFFGTVSYLHTFSRDDVSRRIDTAPGTERIGKIAPGGVFGFNFGMGLGINERSSFSIGYDHSSIGKTRINGKTPESSVRVELGTLLLGYSLRLDPKRSLNVSLGAGLTRDTPDLTLTVRMPTSF